MMKPRAHICRLLTVLCAGAALQACAGPDAFEPVAANNLYSCDNASQIVISIGDQSKNAVVLYNGLNIPLTRAADQGGALVYTNSIYTLHYKDKLATLEREGTPLLTNCSGA